MKRSPSSSPPSVKSESREETPCPPPPSTPKTKKAKKATTASPRTPVNKTSSNINAPWKSTPGWTPDKKRALEIKIIETGIAGLDKAEVADEFNLTKSQINNAFSRGMKSNLRDQLIKKAGGTPN